MKREKTEERERENPLCELMPVTIFLHPDSLHLENPVTFAYCCIPLLGFDF